MQIKNKKWMNIILLSLYGFIIIFTFEIIPRLSILGSLSYKWISNTLFYGSSDSIEQKVKEKTLLNSELKSGISLIVSNYKKNHNISDVICMLDTISSKCKCHIMEIKPGNIIKKDHLWSQPVELNLISSYVGFYNYLLMLEDFPKVIVIKSLSITPIKQFSDTLNIKANLEIYLNI